MLPEGNRHPPIHGSGGGFVQNFSGAELSKILSIQDEVVLDLSLMIGTGDGGQGGRGGDVGCNNVGYQQIIHNASRPKGGLSSSFAIFV